MTKFAVNAKLGRIVSTVEDNVQLNLDTVEKWANMNKMQFNREKHVLHLDSKNIMDMYQIRHTLLSIGSQYDVVAKKVNVILVYNVYIVSRT